MRNWCIPRAFPATSLRPVLTQGALAPPYLAPRPISFGEITNTQRRPFPSEEMVYSSEGPQPYDAVPPRSLPYEKMANSGRIHRASNLATARPLPSVGFIGHPIPNLPPPPPRPVVYQSLVNTRGGRHAPNLAPPQPPSHWGTAGTDTDPRPCISAPPLRPAPRFYLLGNSGCSTKPSPIKYCPPPPPPGPFVSGGGDTDSQRPLPLHLAPSEMVNT